MNSKVWIFISNIFLGIIFDIFSLLNEIIIIIDNGNTILKNWVDFRMSFGIIDAIRMNRIISPPTNTKNSLNPTHTDKNIFLVIRAMIEDIVINSRIIILGLFQFIKFIEINEIIIIVVTA